MNLIQKNGPVTINDLTSHLHINRGRLQRIMQAMENSNLIAATGYTDSTGGRKSVLYDVNCRDYFVAGMAIGSIRYSLFIVNLKNRLLISRQYPLSTKLTFDQFAVDTCRQLHGLAEEAGISYSALIGMGVGIPGVIDRQAGILIRQHSDFFHESWINTPIRQTLQEVFSLPTVLDLNIYGETLSYYYYGEGRESDNLMSVSCSMSIMNAFISKGRLFRSMNDHSDALAHITVDINGLLCKCGNYGCIDCYSSVQAILKRFTSDLKLGGHSSVKKDIGQISIHDITAAAALGDPASRSAIEYGARVLGCGLANYMRLLNPDTVVLNGIMIDESDLYYDTVIQTVKRQLKYVENNLRIRFIRHTKAESRAFSVSAGALFLESILNSDERFIPKFSSVKA
ncbi:MAG: ROK family transcriptional regulator [Lachnospiraceae bacterium]|nr:ROK family transcriptional regulator [Lachnospiraceae bacterium]